MIHISRTLTCTALAIGLVLFCYSISPAQTKKQTAAAVKFARATFVSKIEKGMPRQRFDIWFRRLAGHKMKMHYEVNDCGEQTGTPADRGRDFRMCVEASAQTYVVGLRVTMQVGTFRKGITISKPIIRGVRIDEEGEEPSDFDSLAELVKFLKQAWGK